MESTHIQARFTFRDLADVKAFMELLAESLGSKQRAAGALVQMGMASNSATMTEARRDTRATVEQLIDVYREFKRLHPIQCKEAECKVTDAMVDEAISDLADLREEIDKSQREADALPPITRTEELSSMLGTLGDIFGQPFSGPATIGDVPPETRDASTGTGMYL